MSRNSFRLFRRKNSKRGWYLADITVDGALYRARPLKTSDRANAEKAATLLMQRIAHMKKLAVENTGRPKPRRKPEPLSQKKAAPPPEAIPSPPAARPHSRPKVRVLVREPAPEVAERLKAIGPIADTLPPPPPPVPDAEPDDQPDPENDTPPPIGDVPITPDGVDPPQPEAGEEEAGDLFADIMAEAVVTGTVKVVADQLKKRKPPKRAAVPHEKSAEWYREGLSFRLRAMMGNAAMGPNAKLLVGFCGVVLSMIVGAEDMEPPPPEAATANVNRDETEADDHQAAPPAPPRSPPPPPAALGSPASNGSPAIGKFR